ncbi:MAG: helix-turn-helix domain-containing protein [Actinomycetota bacterium]
MTFGERLRGERARVRISQSELTRLSGVPKTMLSRYENDHILPSIATLHKLARALGIHESALLGDGEGSDAFLDALRDRGIVVETDAQAARLVNVVADMVADMAEAGDARFAFLGAQRVAPETNARKAFLARR